MSSDQAICERAYRARRLRGAPQNTGEPAVGPTLGYPWTFYILCDAPDHETLVTVVDQLRQGDFPLYKYIKLEVRTGRAATELGLP